MIPTGEKQLEGKPKQLDKTVASRLCDKHYQDLVKVRRLAPNWIKVNCRSLTTEEATQRLGYPAKSGGILLEGQGLQIQFKPDKPWKKEGEKKAAKYRSQMGDYDAMLPIHPDDPAYWTDLEALKIKCYFVDGHPCLILTEGFFKAIAGCSNNIPTIALVGVEMGLTSSKADIQGKRYLVQMLEKYARAGFGFIIVYDADCAFNLNVLQAQQQLGKQLLKFGVPVYCATGLWSVEEGKGMDDYIQANGADKFKREVLGKVVNLEGWERQIASTQADGDKPCPRPPKAAAMAEKLADKYRLLLAWHDKEKCWYRYEAESPGIWSEESDEAVAAVIDAEVSAEIGSIYGSAYISDILKLLKWRLLKKKWNERGDLIPLSDGVLRKDSLELLTHSSEYNLTWSLPIRWKDRSSGCEPIKAWMLEIMKGDRALVEVLRALLNCVIFGRANYQRYLEAIGPGGTGKGTFFRLATALVGDKNVFPSTLKNLEENRFELAAAAKAKLIVITEAEKYGGEVNVLKAITGQDKNRIEVKGRQQKCGDGFTFKGFVMLSANEPCQNADYTSGLERRRLSVPFNVQTPPEFRRDLDEEFQPYIPGLLEWVLTMPEAEVRSLVVNTNKSVSTLARVRGEALCDANPLADWLDACLILDPDSKTYVGLDDPERTTDWLYANYTIFIRQTNCRPVAQQRYTRLLEDLCCNQLKIPGIKRGRDRYGSFFTGLRIRTKGDTDPRPITGNEPPEPPDTPPRTDSPSVTEDSGDCDESVTAETIASDGCDGCDGFLEIQPTSEKIHTELPNSITPVKVEVIESVEECGENPSHPSHPSPVSISPVADTSSSPSQPVTEPSQVPAVVDELESWTTYHKHKSYPNPNSDNVRASQKRALKIREAYRAARTKEDLSALRRENGGDFSKEECFWVYSWLKNFFQAEYNYVQATAKISQPSLLDGNSSL